MLPQINPVVLEIGRLYFEGNIIPHSWFQHIKFNSGKADLPAIMILSEVVYWYRPIRELNEKTGMPKPPRQKFSGNMFQSDAMYYVNKFGITKKQARDALKRLEDGGFIRREYRNIQTKEGMVLNDRMFVEPIFPKIMEITYWQTKTKRDIKESPVSEGGSPVSEGGSPVSDHTKISTEISTKKHTHTDLDLTRENENSPKKSVCVLEELNDSEKAAWKWAQSHDFWKGRITTLKQLKSNLEDNKAFRVQFEQTRPAVKPVNGKKVKSVWKKMKIDDCPYCNEQGMIEWCGRIRMEILPCPHNHDEVKRLALKKEATIGKAKSGYEDPAAGLKKPKIALAEKTRTREKVERMIGGFQAN